MKRFQQALLASGLLLLAAAPAPAWEWSYGPPNTIDDAFRRVHPVPACGPLGPGYIAVGTQDAGFGNPDVYVVYTDLLGNSATRWEATYDVQGQGLQDEGMAIVSIPNQGYVFLSNSLNGVWRPALTFIDCKGTVIWSRIYLDVISPAGFDLEGRDLIRTQTGNPNAVPATNPGDLAVAGVWWNGADDDAFLMRTNAAGNLIWNIAHNTGLPEAFNALTEALPVAPEPAGDLVAVGSSTTAAGLQQALVARVNGNNGVIGALPQCFQRHGSNVSPEVYNSVTRLANFFPGQFAFVGTTTFAAAGGWQEDIWVTRGNTCALTAQARFGNPGGAITSEHGNDIIEVLVAKPGAPVGSLAIAGDHGPAGGPYDAALMLLNPGLVPLAGQHRIFGDFGPFDETFFSLAEDPAGWPVAPGYILAGLTQTPWTVGDPQDMYLVHDDPNVIVCEKPWNPVRVATGWAQLNLPSQPRRPARTLVVPTPQVWQVTGKQICNP